MLDEDRLELGGLGGLLELLERAGGGVHEREGGDDDAGGVYVRAGGE